MGTPRVRSRSADPVYITSMSYVNGVLLNTFQQPLYISEESMSDVVTDNFQSRIRAGEIINNNLSYTRESESLSEDKTNYSIVVKDNGDQYTYSSDYNVTERFLHHVYTPYIGQPLAQLNSSTELAIAKQFALANVDRTPTAFLEDLGEIRETIEFLKHPLDALTRLMKTYVKHRKSLQGIRNVWERTQALASLWNQYRFAAMPLLRSMVDLMELLANEAPARPERRRASGRSYLEDSSSEPTIYRATPILYSRVYQYEANGYRRHDYHASILYEVSNPLADWKYKFGLRLKDIPTTGWELLPLSFMLDRLLNIRNFFAGMINFLDPSVTFLAASTVLRDRSMYTYSLTEFQDIRYTVTLTEFDFVQYDYFTMTRTTWTPNPFDTVPSWTPGGLYKDLTSIVDLVAIVISLIPGSTPGNR